MEFRQSVLPNGLQVIGEINPRAQSAAIGFYVRTGSRNETADCAGVSHFLEHMAFKGNERFSAADVNRVFDELGANYNAQTGEEFTLYYAAVLPEYLPRVFELLSALMQPTLRPDDFEVEKQVILEEIGMYDDMPGFLAHDQVMAAHFAQHPLGQSILGTKEDILALTSERMRSYFQQRYHTGNITLVAAGRVNWEQILSLANQHCLSFPTGSRQEQWALCNPPESRFCATRPTLSQTHTMLFSSAPTSRDPLRFAAEMLSVIVGDGDSGRLYWELVDPGHAESCDLAYNEFFDNGIWGGYLCCDPEETEDNIAKMAEVFEEINESGVTAEELNEAFNKVASRIVLRSERPMGRLSVIGSDWVYREQYRSVEEEIEAYRCVSLADIRQLLDQYPLAMTTITELKQESESSTESAHDSEETHSS